MTADAVRPWLDDILDAIDWIERITAGRSLAEYRANRPMRDAYRRVDHAMVWEVVELDLPPLPQAVERMLADLDGGRQ
jgi:uncharacterized protein with HEPN domain